MPPLLHAVSCDNNELVTLLTKFGAKLDYSDVLGRTALHFAIGYDDMTFERQLEWSDTSTAEILLSAGADANVMDTKGCTPLYLACSRGNSEFVKVLLSRGANPNIGTTGNYPLLAACSGQHYDSVKLLVEYNADVNVHDKNGKTALHHALESKSYHSIVLSHAMGLYHPRATSSRYSDTAVALNNTKSIIDVLLESKADVDIADICGETSLYRAASRGLLDVVRKMLQVYGGNPNKGSPDKSPLAAACGRQNVELVKMLLKYKADPNLASLSCYPNSQHRLPLFVAVDKGNNTIIMSLLNAGACVNVVNHEGRSVVCFAVENLIRLTSVYCHSTEETEKELSTIHLLLQRGADLNMLMPDGHSPLYLVVTALARAQRDSVVKLLQLMVKHGAMLQDSSSQLGNSICSQSLDSETLKALATFDGKHEFIVDLFRAGAGFQLIAFCCNAVATTPWEAKSIRLCQAVVRAGYTLSDEELRNLQLAAATENAADGVLIQLVNWLNNRCQVCNANVAFTSDDCCQMLFISRPYFQPLTNYH